MDNHSQLKDTDQGQFPELWYEIVEQNHFWFYWRLRSLLKVIRKLRIDLNANHKGLDIGSGNALLIKQMELLSLWAIDGCDISPKFIKNTKIRGFYIQYDIFEKDKELKEKYDFVFLFDILEHLNDPKTFLEAAAFYLKKGGLIFINVPAFQTLYGKYDLAVGHKARYDRKSINSWLGSALFSIEDFRYWGMILYPLVLIRKLLTTYSNNNVKIITRGMKTPNKYINELLKYVANIETTFISKPPFGCSLILTLRKK